MTREEIEDALYGFVPKRVIDGGGWLDDDLIDFAINMVSRHNQEIIDLLKNSSQSMWTFQEDLIRKAKP